MSASDEDELREAIERIVRSTSTKRLVVAGPGAGKTTLFRKLLEASDGDAKNRLVLTFINNLRADLERELGDLASVFTLHGYCQSLLRRDSRLRSGLTERFRCYPGLISIIKQDWEWLVGKEPPTFVDQMRALALPDEQQKFYYERSRYYDAVDFDDSVYRTHQALASTPEGIPNYRLLLVDEFQDFNRMESAVIDLLAEQSPTTIAGDDDQALYSQLRGASWEYIRKLHAEGRYATFELPFCMRCPEVVVSAVNDVVEGAAKLGKLAGRIRKPYRYFAPAKAHDSQLFQLIEWVTTSVQRDNANYFGRFIAERINELTNAEKELAAERHEPAVLVIGSKPYLPQIEKYLAEQNLLAQNDDNELTEHEQALELLATDPNSNLAWRIILSAQEVDAARKVVQSANEQATPLSEQLSPAMKDGALNEALAFVEKRAKQVKEGADKSTPIVKLTSYEGSKGLAAQFVYLVGLQEGDLPRNAANPLDIEICKFLVGLTRTKKRCTILVTKNFAGNFKKTSPFLNWIRAERFEFIDVDAKYWKRG